MSLTVDEAIELARNSERGELDLSGNGFAVLPGHLGLNFWESPDVEANWN
ncbi:hypothetical protein ABT369_37100 [Dactylosporangium sp. NPDC000244]